MSVRTQDETSHKRNGKEIDSLAGIGHLGHRASIAPKLRLRFTPPVSASFGTVWLH